MMKVAHVETDVAGRGIAETEEGRVLVVFASYTLAGENIVSSIR